MLPHTSKSLGLTSVYLLNMFVMDTARMDAMMDQMNLTVKTGNVTKIIGSVLMTRNV